MKRQEFKGYVRQELSHSPPESKQQVEAHKKVSDLYVEFGEKLADVVPGSENGRQMVAFLTMSRAWAQKAVAQDFKVADYLDNNRSE